MTPLTFAQILYQQFGSNSTVTNTIRTELNTLALNIATDPAYGTQITSATVNGQSYAGAVGMSNLDRLAALRAFVRAADNQVPPSSRTYARF